MQQSSQRTVATPIDLERVPTHRWPRAVRVWAQKNPIGMLGFTLIGVLTLIAITADMLAAYHPLDQSAAANLGISSEHFLGTDTLGRDVFTHLVYGARVSLMVGVVSVLLGVTGGAILGLASAYIGGWFDLSVQRLIDAMSAIPGIILALVLMAVLGRSATNVVIALAIGFLPISTRVVRSVGLREKENPYVDAARALGASSNRIVFRHILPNCVSPYLVLVGVTVGGAIVAEASLSFLGAGVSPETPSWGSMLSVAASSYFDTTAGLALGPGIAITLAVLGFNLFGDAMRDTLDPKLRRG